ncbi:MAG TPA: GNAT family N-acetyltransferase [Microvirga sp.]|jgi:GNAT superfamily N-acetyltransferase|nr:GNAT family N-acetyltransferase [Microvirga sp.]
MSPLAPGYDLRATRAGDIAALPLIERNAAELYWSIDLWEPPFEGVHSLGEHRVAVDAGISWLVTHDETPCAFALGAVFDGHLHLHELAVEPAHQRRRLGTALLEAVIDHARWRFDPVLTLTTDRFAPWNAPFYSRHGFVILDPGRLQPDLAAVMELERRSGFDMSRRVAMAKVL